RAWRRSSLRWRRRRALHLRCALGRSSGRSAGRRPAALLTLWRRSALRCARLTATATLLGRALFRARRLPGRRSASRLANALLSRALVLLRHRPALRPGSGLRRALRSTASTLAQRALVLRPARTAGWRSTLEPLLCGRRRLRNLSRLRRAPAFLQSALFL